MVFVVVYYSYLTFWRHFHLAQSGSSGEALPRAEEQMAVMGGR